MDAQTKHHLTAGREFYRSGEYDKACAHLQAVLVTHDDYADVHNMLGMVHYASGRTHKALEHFERAHALNGRYTEAALNLAICYNELGRYADAERVYMGAQTPSDGGGLETLDPFVRGKIANMHSDLGDAYVAARLFDHAVREYRKALRVCPTFVDIRTKLGATLREQGKIDQAIDELQVIVEVAPNYLPGRTQLGVALWRAGNTTAAREHWRFVLAHDPRNRSCRVYLQMTKQESAP